MPRPEASQLVSSCSAAPTIVLVPIPCVHTGSGVIYSMNGWWAEFNYLLAIAVEDRDVHLEDFLLAAFHNIQRLGCTDRL